MCKIGIVLSFRRFNRHKWNSVSIYSTQRVNCESDTWSIWYNGVENTIPSKCNTKTHWTFQVSQVPLGTAESGHILWLSAGDTPVISLMVGVVMLPGSFVVHRESLNRFCWQSLKKKSRTSKSGFLRTLVEKT